MKRQGGKWCCITGFFSCLYQPECSWRLSWELGNLNGLKYAVNELPMNSRRCRDPAAAWPVAGGRRRPLWSAYARQRGRISRTFFFPKELDFPHSWKLLKLYCEHPCEQGGQRIQLQGVRERQSKRKRDRRNVIVYKERNWAYCRCILRTLSI